MKERTRLGPWAAAARRRRVVVGSALERLLDGEFDLLGLRAGLEGVDDCALGAGRHEAAQK
jgi:hypothetical protein